MSATSSSPRSQGHSFMPGLWLSAGFLGLASITFMLRPWGVTPSTVTESAAKIRLEKIAKLRTEQDKLASSFGWVDKAKGVAHIPIPQAMEAIVAQLRTNPPHAAYPITTIQLSAITAAGAPLYPELPPIDPNAIAAAIQADGGAAPASPVPAPAKKP